MFYQHLQGNLLLAIAAAMPVLMPSLSFSQSLPSAADRDSQPKLAIEVRRISYPEQDQDSSPEALSTLLQNVDLSQVRIGGGHVIPAVSTEPDRQEIRQLAPVQPELNSNSSVAGSGIGLNCYMTIQLTDDQHAAFWEDIKSDARWNISQAPTVLMQAMNSTVIADAVQRPFVTGLKPTDGGTFTTAMQPEISIFSEGTTLKITTGEMKQNNVDLNLQFKQSQINNVKTIAFKKGDDQETRLQLPEVQTKVSEVNISAETGRTVLVLLGPTESLERVEVGVPVPGMDRVFRRTKDKTRNVRRMNALLVTVKDVSEK